MITSSGGYSSHVELFLNIADKRLRLGQVGPEYCILREAAEFPPCEAEILILVDGEKSRVPVHLPRGIEPTSRTVPYVELRPAS